MKLMHSFEVHSNESEQSVLGWNKSFRLIIPFLLYRPFEIILIRLIHGFMKVRGIRV